jgi:hypothetical protein
VVGTLPYYLDVQSLVRGVRARASPHW